MENARFGFDGALFVPVSGELAVKSSVNDVKCLSTAIFRIVVSVGGSTIQRAHVLRLVILCYCVDAAVIL